MSERISALCWRRSIGNANDDCVTEKNLGFLAFWHCKLNYSANENRQKREKAKGTSKPVIVSPFCSNREIEGTFFSYCSVADGGQKKTFPKRDFLFRFPPKLIGFLFDFSLRTSIVYFSSFCFPPK
jgi:hypothetical protein